MHASGPFGKLLLLAGLLGLPFAAASPRGQEPGIGELTPATTTELDDAQADLAAAEDPSVEDEPLSFTVSSPWPAIVNCGWWPAYGDLTNRSDARLEGVIQVRSWNQGGQIEVPFSLGPHESTRLEIELPAFFVREHGVRDSSYSLTAEIRGRRDVRVHESVQRDSSAGVRAIVVATPRLLEGGIEASWAEQLKGAEVAKGGGGPRHLALSAAARVAMAVPAATGGLRPDLEIAQVAYEELPTRVAAYSSLDLVLVPDAKQLPEAERMAALFSWVSSGGKLALIGPATVKAARRHPELAPWLEPRFRVAGSADGGAIQACGMGWIAISDEPSPLSQGASDIVKQLLEEFPSVAPAPPSAASSIVAARTSDWTPRIPGLDEVPVRAFIAVLFLFWLLIGPINFYVVSTRWKKPALLLVTIPALALLFSLLLFGYGLADQGLSTRTAVQSFSVLDQRTHRANSIDVRQLFVGFSAGDGLRPGANTVVYPGLDAPSSHDDGYRIDAGPDGGLSGSFCPVRTPQILQVQSERTSRLRCELISQSDGVRFRNGLESEIQALLVRDFSGRVWRSSARIAAGAEGRLEPVADPAGALQDFERDRGLGRIAFVEGSYLARLVTNSLLDDCALDAEEVQGSHAILGFFELEAR